MSKPETIELYNGDVKILFYESNHAYYKETEILKKDGTPKLERLKGSTSYIGIIDKPALIPWAVNTTVEFVRDHLDLLQQVDGNELLNMARQEADRQKDEASEIGKAIHKWIEDHVKGKNPEMPDDERVLEGVNSFMNWISEYKVNFIWSERVVYSKKYNYVGTADIGVEIDGKKYLVDIKTGNSIYEEVKLQTASYLNAIQEETDEKYQGRYVLRISKETEDQYMERMEKKNDKYKYPREIAPFKIFESIYLDDDRTALKRDLEAFVNAVELSNWKQNAYKELNQLKQ